MARYQRGTLVFWLEDKKPWWIVEWQENNGTIGAYWIVDANGKSGVASEGELSLFPGEARVLKGGWPE